MATVPSATGVRALLDAEHAAFLQSGVSIVAASRDARFVPVLSRASGCRVSAKRRQVTLFFWRPQAQPLLAAIVETGLIAVVFSDPPTHRTLQVKSGCPN